MSLRTASSAAHPAPSAARAAGLAARPARPLTFSRSTRAAARALGLALLALLAVGCGPPRYLRVETGAEEIRQPSAGQSLLAAAPPTGHDVRIAFGGGVNRGSLAEGTFDSKLSQSSGHVGGELAFTVGDEAEISVVSRGGLGRPLTQTALDFQWGLRLRLAPGGERFRLGLSAEVGGRNVSVRQGKSLVCDLEAGELPDEWRPAANGTCFESEFRRGDGDESMVPYLAATVFPTVRVGDNAWLFVGLGLDTLVHHYRSEQVLEVYNNVVSIRRLDETEYETRWVPSAVAGLDLKLDERFGLLLNGRVAGALDGDPDAMAVTVEAAVQAVF